jgi:hypothetical protein
MKSRMVVIATLALASLALASGSAPGEEHHIKAALEANGSSGVDGFVQLTQLPHGGTNIEVVVLHGLQSGTTYSSFYYESSTCTEPADLLGNLKVNSDGTGDLQGKIDDDLDEVGSVSVRLGPGYGALQACAKVH